LPIIFLTGQGDIPASVYAIKQGAEDFLIKPVKKEILFGAIECALARDGRERPQRVRHGEFRARFDMSRRASAKCWRKSCAAS